MNKISRCEHCLAIWVEDKFKPFHKANCPNNKLNIKEYNIESNRRALKLFNTLNDELKYAKWSERMTNKGLADSLIDLVWSKQIAGTKEEALINRAIQILFDLDEKK